MRRDSRPPIVPAPRGRVVCGVVERNWYLIKRYGWWELAFFFRPLAAPPADPSSSRKESRRRGGKIASPGQPTLLIGAVIWSYLGLVFEFMTETVAWERWEGTIEYTFMAPIRRLVHLAGVGIFAVASHGVLRSAVCFSSSR